MVTFTHWSKYVKSCILIGTIFLAGLPGGLYAAEPVSKDIFLKRGETLDREVIDSKLAKHLFPCVSLTSNKSLPSGYARLLVGVDNEKTKIRLERSTFQDKFIDSCIVERADDFLLKDRGPRSWQFTHVVSECKQKKSSGFYDPGNVDCKVNVVLNNFSENKELKDIVERHWKKEGLETSPVYYNAAQILNLLRAFQK
jgi:hypothetical protein